MQNNLDESNHDMSVITQPHNSWKVKRHGSSRILTKSKLSAWGVGQQRLLFQQTQS
jgi:hypothetical protein